MSPVKGETGTWKIGEHALACHVCKGSQFAYKEDLEGGRAMQYFGGPLFTPKVAVLECTTCTFRMDFGNPNALHRT